MSAVKCSYRWTPPFFLCKLALSLFHQNVMRCSGFKKWVCLSACLVFLQPDIVFAGWAAARAPLMTRWAAEVSPTNVWPEYPRPQLVRADWLNLNGLWDYAITSDSVDTMPACDGQILVPFPIESALSGVMKKFDEHSKLWYHRTFTVPESWRGRRVRLHLGAVDWQCRLGVNGREIGEHRGGYDAFTFDITDALQWNGAEEISLCVTDPTEGDQPRGKQSRKPEGIFYTSTSGVWQTAWLEPVPEVCLDGLRLTPEITAGGLKIRAAVTSRSDQFEVEAVATLNGKEVGRAAGKPNQTFLLLVSDPHLWTPDDPFLYDLRVTLKDGGRVIDSVTSYFGMRKIGLKKDDQGRTRIALNDRFIFEIGTLDQGFWPDGIYTAPTDEALRFDLQFLKSAGFNLIRKHVKVEPQRWYYWCDKMGLLVWQDMPSGDNRTADARQDFEIELQRMIEGLYDHPSIVQWVLFNEGWGQYDTDRLVAKIKKLDPTRLVDDASGWTDMIAGDVIDVHSYPEPVGTEPDPQRAIVLGEYGGIGIGVGKHSWAGKSWGYQMVGFLERLPAWYFHLLHEVWDLHDKTGLSAAVYTQTTDIESECNGLMTYDREVMKLNPALIRSANQGIFSNAVPGFSVPNGSLGQSIPPLMQMSNRESSSNAFQRIIVSDAIMDEPVWRYAFQQPANGWLLADFDDSQWKEGKAGFGTRGTPGAIVRTFWNTADIWMRRKIVLQKEDLNNPRLEMHHDEDVEVYLNGALAFKQSGFLLDYSAFDIRPEAHRALRAGTNTIAVHCHQTIGGQYIDVGIVEKLPTK
jgi:Glycosyl hydrolases family 2/Glycosyl hydrolases family 2, sugar binding domain/Glycosyl hydrolases family 2, TIM barrel domain